MPTYQARNPSDCSLSSATLSENLSSVRPDITSTSGHETRGDGSDMLHQGSTRIDTASLGDEEASTRYQAKFKRVVETSKSICSAIRDGHRSHGPNTRQRSSIWGNDNQGASKPYQHLPKVWSPNQARDTSEEGPRTLARYITEMAETPIVHPLTHTTPRRLKNHEAVGFGH